MKMDAKLMQRLGFTPKQILYLKESVEKSVTDILNESLEKASLLRWRYA